jgi:uncharacterized protein
MIFVDTSAWLALVDSRDRNHSAALQVARRLAHGEFGKQATTNYVMAESMTIIRRRLGLDGAVKFAAGLESSREVRVFWIEPVHHREAVKLMIGRPDKLWSLFDCTSFVVMHSLGINSAFAFDDDFEQAGFTAVRQ